jgi:hypothetical protein
VGSGFVGLIERDPAERGGGGGLTGVDDGQAGVLERRAVARHAGAAEDEDVGAVFVAEGGADLGHAGEGCGPVGEFRDAQVQRPVTGKAVHHAHGPEGAQVAGDGGGQDRDDAEALAEGEGGCDGGLLDAEDGFGGAVAQRVEAGVAEAGDDEGGGVGKGLGEGQQMRDREVGLGLAFDAGRALGRVRQAMSTPRPLAMGRRGAMAASIPSVTASVELGLMT